MMKPAAAMSDGSRVNLVELAKEAEAEADRLRSCQVARVGERGR